MSTPIGDALRKAVEDQFTRQPPVSTQARARFLVKKLGATRPVADLLGVSQRTVERYLTGQRKQPPAEIAGRLEQEVRARWQPLVRKRAIDRAATTRGVAVETRATFGFDAPAGSTDDARLRRIAQQLDPAATARLFEAAQTGAEEAELAQLVAEGLAHIYFRDGGRRAHGLDVRLTDIDYVIIDL
ncbi:telomere-protecting terminal protein Tpg [Streptacidiphilus fuscans]|uniref:XRE family transcriptional regulator n=1 Tax=Streptacidiphilus fuscans TaxID=2789292 RepID=A0A931BET1_9ACTN|nr:XRE family transcriptional regulator [Streptacidiphilus fuscans]MBF9072848.1 XRE family transcriptional regulator [Streptacidiphilus fuscans]